ncbi:MAG: zinc ribbon domain-containing protein [Eubacteriaceae bacterium]|nr:zinc ribbon domain-containing protein [Eubacteriaceae bacterium]
MYCGNCGKKLPDGALFCPHCGKTSEIGQSQGAYASMKQPEIDAAPNEDYDDIISKFPSGESARDYREFRFSDFSYEMRQLRRNFQKDAAALRRRFFRDRSDRRRGYRDDELDETTFGQRALCLFMPIFGLFFYLSWRDTYPNRAREASTWAIRGLVLRLLLR